MCGELCQEIKTVTRDLEQLAREVLAVLQALHQSPSPEGMQSQIYFDCRSQESITKHLDLESPNLHLLSTH